MSQSNVPVDFQGFAARKISALQLCHSCGSQPGSRTFSRAPVYHILCVRRLRGPTISGRGFNLFKALRRHFRATPCRQPRRDPGDRTARRSPLGRRRRTRSSDDNCGGRYRDGAATVGPDVARSRRPPDRHRMDQWSDDQNEGSVRTWRHKCHARPAKASNPGAAHAAALDSRFRGNDSVKDRIIGHAAHWVHCVMEISKAGEGGDKSRFLRGFVYFQGFAARKISASLERRRRL